ncbi:hypothetical protein C8J56DRAFT_781593 [Mycena floridula]|nr:hypothetical protein C8J56DRAFT_781593 [Mycena floridula]
MATLQRPSQFIGFDKISRPSPPVPRQFENFPLLLTQVDSANPDKFFGQYLKKYTASIGTVYPEIRRVQITDTISTIAQFRAIDYGMEICELHVKLNSSTAPALQLHRLEEKNALDSLQLAFNSRPKRALTLSEIKPSYEAETIWRRNFTCQSEQLLTFELACSPSATGCLLEWWQSPDSFDSPGRSHTAYQNLI